jgi:hypothetical protein
VVQPYQYKSPLQKNQFVMRTDAEIQAIIDSYPDNWTKKDFRGEGKLNKTKILTRKETERPGLNFKFKGKRTFKEPNLENKKRTEIIKKTQGSNISVKGAGQTGKQFSHIFPLIESAKPGTKSTFVINAKMNRALEGYNKTGQKIAEAQEILIKTKPEGYKEEILKLNAQAKKNVDDAVNNLGKNFKGTIGYFRVNPETGEFIKKGGDYQKTFAGVKGEDEIFFDMTGKERKDFEKKISLKWNNDIGAFETANGDVATQEDLKLYSEENPMEVKVGEEPPKVNKSVLKTVGKTLAKIGAPLPTALIDGYFINKQMDEGKSTAEIAKDPLNWIGLAAMEPLSKVSGIAESGGLNKALRLGLNPATIRGISRFAGLPGLAISTAMTAYDQYKKYQNEEGFVYNLFNKEGN